MCHLGGGEGQSGELGNGGEGCYVSYRRVKRKNAVFVVVCGDMTSKTYNHHREPGIDSTCFVVVIEGNVYVQRLGGLGHHTSWIIAI